MAEEVWSYTSLGALAAPARGAVAIGPFGSAMKADVYTVSGVPVLRGTNISENRGWKGEWVNVSEAFADGMHRCVVGVGDLVFPHRGSIGEVALIPDVGPARYMMSSSLMKITLDRSKVEPLFVYYYFRSKEGREEVLRFASQVGTPGIGQPLQSLRQFRLPLPPLDEQKTIGSLLSVLDDKIDLNRRMNETLEAMARAIFKDWFVDFGPTRAKIAGREPYLPAEIWEFFPSELGEGGRPLIWHLRPLVEVATILMGASPKGESYNSVGDGVPLVNGPVEFGDYFVVRSKWTTDPGRLSRNGDLILCVRGSTTGRYAFADGEYCIGRGVAAIRSTDSQSDFATDTLLFDMPRLLQKTTGSVFPSLSSDDIKSFPVLWPDTAIRRHYSSIVHPLRQRIWANHIERVTLAETRDLLLPKLMSGELRVRDAERSIEEVL